jgi:hypothetical protein
MAKKLDLSAEVLNAPVAPPQAARIAFIEAPATKVPHVPLQIRIPRADAKAIKRAAVEAEKTISDFMLECFHACMQTNKQA